MTKLNQTILYSKKDFWGFLAPALLGTFIFVLIPICASFCLSFFEWDLLHPPEFVGLKNYQTIFATSEYVQTLCNTLYYAVAVTVFGLLLPLYAAYFVVKKFTGSELFKVVSILPYITPMVVAGTVWAWIFDPGGGLVNNLFQADARWLYDKSLAMPVLIFVSVWKLFGYNLMLFVTGFANINLSLIEAAEIDGANDWQIFAKIIIPMMLPMIGFVSMVTVISSFQVFDLVYMMTQGGPDGATEVIVYTIFKEGFEYFNAGKSCALGYILFLVIAVLSIFMRGVRGKNM